MNPVCWEKKGKQIINEWLQIQNKPYLLVFGVGLLTILFKYLNTKIRIWESFNDGFILS